MHSELSCLVSGTVIVLIMFGSSKIWQALYTNIVFSLHNAQKIQFHKLLLFV